MTEFPQDDASFEPVEEVVGAEPQPPPPEPVFTRNDYTSKRSARFWFGLALTGAVILYFGVGALAWYVDGPHELEELGLFLAPLVTLLASVLTYYYANDRA